MKASLDESGITLDEEPIETPGAIGLSERSNTAYVKHIGTLERTTCDQDWLQMAVFVANSTIGPEGLCTMLLVFGSLPRPSRTTFYPSQAEIYTKIESAKKAVEKEQEKRRVELESRHPSGPKAKEYSARLHDLPDVSPVLIYRTKTDKWVGPYSFISI